MIKNEFYYNSADKMTKIHAVEWLPEGKPKAILQIAHGVSEHILSYNDFAKYLVDKGIVVVGNDHIGHGTSLSPNKRAMHFGPKGSWKYVVEDANTCVKIMKEKYPDIPYCILGFSLGSYLLRTYLIDYPENIDAGIIMGTGQVPSFQIALAKIVANNEAKKVGEDHTTPQINKLTFGEYNKAFSPNRTPCDWLCSNNESLDKYLDDPLRGGDMSAGLFREMLSGMAYTGKIKNISKMNKEIPLLFISGDMDLVGDKGKGVKKAISLYKKAGVKDTELKLYKDLRHDILHEVNCKEVFNDIYNWLERKVIKKSIIKKN